MLSLLKRLFSKPPAQPSAPAAAPSPKKETVWERPMINWNDRKAKVSKYFTVHEATFLPSWNTYHLPSEEEKANIVKMALAMDKVRDLLGPISVHIWIRPKKANTPSSFDPKAVKIAAADPKRAVKEKALAELDYNTFIGGAKQSPHIRGLGVDWHAQVTCDEARAKLLPKLEELGMCMEDLPGSNWVHTDILGPRGNTGRFFKP